MFCLFVCEVEEGKVQSRLFVRIMDGVTVRSEIRYYWVDGDGMGMEGREEGEWVCLSSGVCNLVNVCVNYRSGEVCRETTDGWMGRCRESDDVIVPWYQVLSLPT